MTYLTDFTTWLERQNMDPKSTKAYVRAVQVYATWCEWETGQTFQPTALDGRQLHRFATDPAPYGLRGRTMERPAPATRNKVIAGLRVFCRWAREAGVVKEDLAGNLEFVIGTQKEARALEPEEERRLVRYLNDQVHVATEARTKVKRNQALRDRALVGAGLYLGLRLEEALSLTWEQLILRAGAAEAVSVVGKYGFVRSVPMPNVARKWFLALKEPQVTSGVYNAQGPVFTSQKGHQLSARGAQHLMEELAQVTGITDLTFHVLRHTYGTTLTNATPPTPAPTVARLMGHIRRNGEPNVTTTARYALPRRSDIRRAVAALDYDDGEAEPTLKE